MTGGKQAVKRPASEVALPRHRTIVFPVALVQLNSSPDAFREIRLPEEAQSTLTGPYFGNLRDSVGVGRFGEEVGKIRM